VRQQTQPVKEGSVIDIFHRLPVMPKLIDEYRVAEVRHADDTSWRTDGRSGYAWLFVTETLSVFLFCSTRSASVAREFLGTQPLPGVLVVDRCNGYNRAPCKLQYRYAHLLREVEDLAREASDRREVRAFTATMIPLLAQTPCN
jgi:transposase